MQKYAVMENIKGEFATQLAQTGEKVGGLLDPREFGAVGDGIADDTLALQRWLNEPGRNRELRNGVFKITSGLTSSFPNRNIISVGASIIVGGGSDIDVLKVTGSGSKVSLDIDGQLNACVGVSIQASNCEVVGCRIKNLHGNSKAASGILVNTSGGVSVEGNIIENISSSSNSVIGDNMGSARGVLVTSNVASSRLTSIKNNKISAVLGEEGDSIQVLFFDGTYPFLSANAVIEDNMIVNCNRRAVKVQASDVIVKRNTHFNTLTSADLGNASTIIDIIQSKNVIVSDNKMDASFFKGIQVTGTSTEKALNVTVEKNKIIGGTTQHGIYLNHCKDVSVLDNNLHDGITGISIENSLGCVINDNLLFGGASDKIGINSLPTNNNITICNNLHVSGTRLYLVQNAAPNCIIQNNHSRTGSGANIRTFATSAGSFYKNNTNASSSTTVIGDFTDQFMFGSRNLGTGTSGVPDIVFVSSIPTIATHPSKRWNVGDIVFFNNPTAGGKIGATCITGGVPGSWKSFGVIDS